VLVADELELDQEHAGEFGGEADVARSMNAARP
jgi:hypothetical protein